MVFTSFTHRYRVAHLGIDSQAEGTWSPVRLDGVAGVDGSGIGAEVLPVYRRHTFDEAARRPELVVIDALRLAKSPRIEVRLFDGLVVVA